VHTTNPQHTISEVVSAFRPAVLTVALVTAVAYKKPRADDNGHLTRMTTCSSYLVEGLACVGPGSVKNA